VQPLRSTDNRNIATVDMQIGNPDCTNDNNYKDSGTWAKYLNL